MTVKEAYQYGAYFLAGNGVGEAEFKSLCLVCHLAGIPNRAYNTHQQDEVVLKRFADLLWRVKNGEPLQYVLGQWDFYDSTFFVGPGVLIPRPETEELVDRALEAVKNRKGARILDLCAGSGCIGLSLAKALPDAQVTLLEKSPDAFAYLEKNSCGLSNAHAILADIETADPSLYTADLLVSNPPYIRTGDLPALQAEVQCEPQMALDGGTDGLSFYQVIHDRWCACVVPGGDVFLEIGDEQSKAVCRIFSDFDAVCVHRDLFGHDRIVHAIKP